MLQTDSTNANGLKPHVALSPVAILSHTYIARGAWGSPTYGANLTCADYGIAPSVFFFVSSIPCEALSECVSNYELCVHHDSGFTAYVVSSSILRELLTILAFHSPTCMPWSQSSRNCEPRIRDRPAVNHYRHIQPNYPKHMAPDNQLSLSNQLPRPSRTRPASFGASQEEPSPPRSRTASRKLCSTDPQSQSSVSHGSHGSRCRSRCGTLLSLPSQSLVLGGGTSTSTNDV